MEYIKQFRCGSGPMVQSAIDFYRNEKGEIIKHCWAMGGETKTIVDCVPESIDGYRLFK